jgi:hypothetical protein
VRLARGIRTVKLLLFWLRSISFVTGGGCGRNGDRVIGRGTTARVGSRNSFLERLDHWTW